MLLSRRDGILFFWIAIIIKKQFFSRLISIVESKRFRLKDNLIGIIFVFLLTEY